MIDLFDYKQWLAQYLMGRDLFGTKVTQDFSDLQDLED